MPTAATAHDPHHPGPPHRSPAGTTVARDYAADMRSLTCPRCAAPLWLESLTCESCGLAVMYDPVGSRLVPLDAADLTPCANRGFLCNWALPAGGDEDLCYSCRMIRRRPEPDDAPALAKFAVTGQSQRRLLVGLADLGLPVVPHWERPGGLAFDLLSSRSGDGPVVIGHASGLITIDLAETLDDHRARLKIQLGEPYRTVLGHFRHEVGHYYQWQLLEAPDSPLLPECRALFGDERVSYSEALQRHYRDGAPADWPASFISAYATMHPWEDFAETFAHYQHILLTLGIVATGGLRIEPIGSVIAHPVAPRASYADVSMGVALDDWRGVSHLLNRANHAMGKPDLYPFRIPGAVREKLDFIHRVVVASSVEQPFIGL